MDKMFFIVNAVDLAKDDEEKNEVISYVQSQLVEYGIRFPRIFGVSSKLAMENGTAADSGIEQFKEKFHHFIDGELKMMAAQSAEAEWERGLEKLKTLIENSSMNEKKRDERKRELKEFLEKLQTFFSSEAPESLKLRVKQEIKELVHYVKQRVFLRFSDFFKEAFHPAVFSQHSSSKGALNAALDELLESVGFDFSQEMRATSLRVEKFAEKQLTSRFEVYVDKIAKMQENLIFSPIEFGDPDEIEFLQAFSELDRDHFQPALKLFKNPKDFFENNGKKKMMEKLNDDLQSPADEYLALSQTRIDEWAMKFLEEEHKRMTDYLRNQSEEQVNSWLEALQSSENLESWKEAYRKLSSNR